MRYPEYTIYIAALGTSFKNGGSPVRVYPCPDDNRFFHITSRVRI